MNIVENYPLSFLGNEFFALEDNSKVDLIQSLLYEIVRVKSLIKYYNSAPNSGGQSGAPILNELIVEAYSSLVNYDIELMSKYYDLLQNCD